MELCCICIALPKLIETRIVYLIDLHAGMVIICVSILMILFGIKSHRDLYHHRLVDLVLLSPAVATSPRG